MSRWCTTGLAKVSLQSNGKHFFLEYFFCLLVKPVPLKFKDFKFFEFDTLENEQIVD